MANSLWSHGLQHTRLPWPSPSPGACSNLGPSSQWCPPTISSSDSSEKHLILLLLLPSIFPSIRVFSNQSALPIRWPKYWSFSFSISFFQWIFRIDFLQDWLVWSPCCPKDSQESSPAPPFRSINSLVFSLLWGPTLTSMHDYWKNHGDLVTKSSLTLVAP